MSIEPVVSVQCSSFREYFSFSNLKSTVHGFIYEYETPKIVTIHSISSKKIEKLILNTIDLSRERFSYRKLVSSDLLFRISYHMINKLEKKLFFIDFSCTYVPFNSTLNFNLWYCIFNDT